MKTCPYCGKTLVEVDNPMRPEFRHRRGEEAFCPGPPAMPAMAAPPPPPPPSGATITYELVDELSAADRATIRARCIEAAARIHVVKYDDGPDPADQLIAIARRLEAYALGQDQAGPTGFITTEGR